MRELLSAGLAELGLDAGKTETLEAFARLVLERNRVMNLTAITDETDFVHLHLLDSAALLNAVDFRGKSVIDVGTGAGFPGVPLRILCPDIHLTLLDSMGKRVAFLREACAALGLDDVECVCARAEDFAAQQRESCDFAVSRAVAGMSMLSELCLPLVRVGGRFLAMKSARSDEEIAQAKRAFDALGGRLERTVDYEIPGSGVVHRAIVVEKTAPTPAGYPRPFAQIKKKPL